MSEIAISGFTPLSTIDYPDHLAAVLFCQGCPFNCPYCHNAQLISQTESKKFSWREIDAFLKTRRGLLDAVVFSGGEPTLQPQLAAVMTSVKNLGFKIGLHTNGFYPENLAQILPMVDWVGMDIKAPFGHYEQITATKNSAEKIKTSIKLLVDNKVECEFRTTIHPSLLTEAQILQMADEVIKLGVNNLTLQKFRVEGCNNQQLCAVNLDNYPSAKLKQQLQERFRRLIVKE
ncbi:MAG: anaerobic ribonucleoside-triphosphate reductase activating protein [Gammaproteobacteria bacterium]|nr:anaerobic ribonucleoside-triphosphate reductase activating protein [Gammaproteobacteria bacterium]